MSRSVIAKGFSDFDRFLRREGRFAVGHPVPYLTLLGFLALGGLTYGAAMGSFGGRVEQSLYSAVKVPLLLVVSSLICLPSFYVVNAVLGLARDFPLATRGIVASQATLAVVLASLSPVLATFYASAPGYDAAKVVNGGLFLVATFGGQRVLARHYAALVRRDPRHRIAKAAWLVVYVFVAIQFAWVLRPFVGVPTLEPRFFREDAWSNAYVHVAETLWRVLR